MKFRRNRNNRIAALDITPLVDVVFLLLVFFLLSLGSPLIGSRINLPETESGGELSMQAVPVVVFNDHLLLQGEESGLEELEQLDPGSDIVVLAEKNVLYARVVSVLDTLRSSGHEKISLGTKAIGEQTE